MKPLRVVSDRDDLVGFGGMVTLQAAFDRETAKFHILTVDAQGTLRTVHESDLIVHPKDARRLWMWAKRKARESS